MAQTGVCFRIDTELKKDFEQFCSSVGLSMSTAVMLFIKTTVREQRIPFEIATAPKAKDYEVKK
ncbi:type II toxin-antitoxin system RelB/DinJ family antitoxin [Megasphaera sp.]|uniref:type II toxin-antitoxin system RelB/DinJ family antitoxin n=1 Tax=Megasphaera sp. TaxID=2023260 RepID=UPI003521F66F